MGGTFHCQEEAAPGRGGNLGRSVGFACRRRDFAPRKSQEKSSGQISFHSLVLRFSPHFSKKRATVVYSDISSMKTNEPVIAKWNRRSREAEGGKSDALMFVPRLVDCPCLWRGPPSSPLAATAAWSVPILQAVPAPEILGSRPAFLGSCKWRCSVHAELRGPLAGLPQSPWQPAFPLSCSSLPVSLARPLHLYSMPLSPLVGWPAARPGIHFQGSPCSVVKMARQSWGFCPCC